MKMSDVDEFHERSWDGINRSEKYQCQHPNLFFKEFKFYCRTCGKEFKNVE